MFVINISCPNVEGLTSLQDVSSLSDIMDSLLDLRTGFDDYKPILLKLSPDLAHSQIDEILDYAMLSGIDGVVAGNTSRKRDGLTIPQEKSMKSVRAACRERLCMRRIWNGTLYSFQNRRKVADCRCRRYYEP